MLCASGGTIRDGLRNRGKNVTRLQRLAWATLGTTLVLVAVGGYTRGSGSGYGCQDRWPLCENGAAGGLLPRWEHHMIVEWTHRWVAAFVGVLALATAVTAWRARRGGQRPARSVVAPAVTAVVLVTAQAYLGRMVVKEELDADLVALHLANAMAVIAMLAVVVVNARPPAHAGDAPLRSATVAGRPAVWTRLVGAGAALSLLVLLLGSSVHNEYVGGWPLVDGKIVPDLSTRVVAVHYAHRVAAGVMAVYAAWLAVQVVRRRRPRGEVILVHTAAAGVLVNALLGAAHVVTEVSSSGIVVAHLAVASITWTCLVLATLLARDVPGASPDADAHEDERSEPLAGARI